MQKVANVDLFFQFRFSSRILLHYHLFFLRFFHYPLFLPDFVNQVEYIGNLVKVLKARVLLPEPKERLNKKELPVDDWMVEFMEGGVTILKGKIGGEFRINVTSGLTSTWIKCKGRPLALA